MAHNLPVQKAEQDVPQRHSSGMGNVLLVVAAFVIGAVIALMMVLGAPARSSPAADKALAAQPNSGAPAAAGVVPH
ncbi:hypothetical protein [Sphingobium subterraneum]|uniref:Uncharacterized protein n=1 Tax=Sphingobium subterraneum TaxID=627688 RepID=A0A841J171_9SPHN|nr:hypothetical protein [Sphingobium subterraneum]MBB6124683.1 hypothetical protein [Sphingobium subterraneum]